MGGIRVCLERCVCVAQIFIATIPTGQGKQTDSWARILGDEWMEVVHLFGIWEVFHACMQSSNYYGRWASEQDSTCSFVLRCGLRGGLVDSLKREKRGRGWSPLAPANHRSGRLSAYSIVWITQRVETMANKANLTTLWFFFAKFVRGNQLCNKVSSVLESTEFFE